MLRPCTHFQGLVVLLLLLTISTHSHASDNGTELRQCGAESGQCEAPYVADVSDPPEQHVQHPQGGSEDSCNSNAFPSNHTARRLTCKQLQDLLHEASLSGSSTNTTLVVLFYLSTCPHSTAMKPVFECLPAFFPSTVQFVTVSYSDMSLMEVMTQGLHALPVLQVHARGRKYRYSGKHRLGQMLSFVSKALGQEPLVSLEVAQLCNAEQQQQLLQQHRTSLTRSAEEDGNLVHDASTTAVDASDSTAVDGSSSGSSSSMPQSQQQVFCGNWSCPRWDGEVTAAELYEQEYSWLFWVSFTFVVCRFLWWVSRRYSGNRQAVTAATATPLALPSDAGVVSADRQLAGSSRHEETRGTATRQQID